MKICKKVAVLGGGSFGTVLANLAASNEYNVSLWVRDSEQALRINSEGANSSYHPELKLSKNIVASENLKEVLQEQKVTDQELKNIDGEIKSLVTNASDFALKSKLPDDNELLTDIYL